jgi:hypothetical protein
MIVVRPNRNADSRSSGDPATVTSQELHDASIQHIADVRRALQFFGEKLVVASVTHDEDKLTDLKSFLDNFHTSFRERDWLDRHIQKNRHHLLERAPEDVNLIDVLDYIADNVMAGLGRQGNLEKMRPLSPDLLWRAYDNTVHLLATNVVPKPHLSECHANNSGLCDCPGFE